MPGPAPACDGQQRGATAKVSRGAEARHRGARGANVCRARPAAHTTPAAGRVYEDTHRVTAELSASSHELEQSDWLPFRHVMAQGDAFTMLSHARLTEIDRERPASFSDAVVKGLLRDTWKHDGILVTDDFSMGAVTFSNEGVAGGAVAALNAGVDLLLVSYDPDQYVPMLHGLVAAARDGRLRTDMLEASAARLRWAAPPLNSASLRAR